MHHAYGEHPDQCADLALPAGDGPFPVAVLVHGGGWAALYDRSLMAMLARDLTERGWATWNLEYRRLGASSRGGWPQTGEDVLAGIDALPGLDAPLDLERVVLVGHSAGGQLALWAAGQRGPSAGGAPVRVRAVVAQAPAADLRGRANAVVTAFLGGTPQDVPERYADASPLERLPIGVPLLVVHLRDDPLIPLSHSEAFVAAAVAAGDDARLAVPPGEGHLEHLQPSSPAWAAALEHLARWGPA